MPIYLHPINLSLFRQILLEEVTEEQPRGWDDRGVYIFKQFLAESGYFQGELGKYTLTQKGRETAELIKNFEHWNKLLKIAESEGIANTFIIHGGDPFERIREIPKCQK